MYSKLVKLENNKTIVNDIFSDYSLKIINNYGNYIIDKYSGEYLYKIENILTKKVYIGKTTNPIRRLIEHFYGPISRTNKELRLDIIKYGQLNFTYECWEPAYDYNKAELVEILKYENRYNKLIIEPKLDGF